MAPPLLNKQKSSLLEKSLESSRAPFTMVLGPPNMSSGDLIDPQPKASTNQNIPREHTATFLVVIWFTEAIVFTKYPSAIISDDTYSLVEEAWNLAIEAQDHHQALLRPHVGKLLVFQSPNGQSLKSDLQIQEVVCLKFC
jgi:hypothetical protein